MRKEFYEKFGTEIQVKTAKEMEAIISEADKWWEERSKEPRPRLRFITK